MNTFRITAAILIVGLAILTKGISQCGYGTTGIIYYTSTGGTGTYGDPATGKIDYKFCFTVSTFFEKSTNWMHGIFVAWADIPPGVSIGKGLTGEQPSQHGSRFWIFIDSAKAKQFALPGIGYYVDDGDGNPTNNYGDNGVGTPNATFPDLLPFCFDATYTCGVPLLIRPVVTVTGDGTTGAWKNPSCPGDAIKATFGGPLDDGIIITCGFILPLDLLSFEGYQRNGVNYFNWSGIADKQFSHYELERKSEGNSSFEKIALYALPIDSRENVVHYLSASDSEWSGEVSYYRLKMVEKDHSFVYSKTISLRSSTLTSDQVIDVYPNPAEEIIFIGFPNASTPTNYKVDLYSISGKLIQSNQFTIRGYNIVKNISVSPLESGIYLLQVKSELETIQNTRLIKL